MQKDMHLAKNGSPNKGIWDQKTGYSRTTQVEWLNYHGSAWAGLIKAEQWFNDVPKYWDWDWITGGNCIVRRCRALGSLPLGWGEGSTLSRHDFLLRQQLFASEMGGGKPNTEQEGSVASDYYPANLRTTPSWLWGSFWKLKTKISPLQVFQQVG